MISNPQIDTIGTKHWYNEKGERHRDGDLPAVVAVNGSKLWWKHGKRHREQDKPAVVWADGEKEWYKNGTRLSHEEVTALKRKWKAIRNGNTNLLTEELLNEL